MTETKMQLVDCEFQLMPRNNSGHTSHQKRQFLTSEIGLDELCVRFIINLPKEELESVERICFQVEEAQWFYEDFIRPLDPELPSLNLRNFCHRIFQHCPLLSGFSTHHHTAAFAEFLAYKNRVPVRGAILLNHDMDKVVLVKGWKKSANWSFPRGKINKGEADLDCAIREVYEETGFDVRDAGLVGEDEDAKYVDITMREQQLRLYIFPNIPMDAQFAPRTRKEISKIQWFKLSELPTLKKQKQPPDQSEDLDIASNKFYMVAPFMVPLRKWISQRKKGEKPQKRNKTTALSDITNDVNLHQQPLFDPQPQQALVFATGPPNADPFAPTTLLSPFEKAVSSPNPAAPLEVQPIILSRTSPANGSQGESSPDHKEILLSLFKKPSHASQPEITSASPSITKPFPERPQSNSASSLTSSPLVSQSKISSITSAMDGRNAPLAGENPLPRTTPGYRNLLLGYLDGVAKNERVAPMC